MVSEGLPIDEIAQSNPQDISKIDAIDEETAKELISDPRNFSKRKRG